VSKNVQRRLAAILVADVVGYTRLMGEDEAGTLAALKAHRAEFIEPKIAEHKGRLIKLMGDGALVEFASVIDALTCAAEVQSGMAERNQKAADGPRIIFRIGVNLGDVIVEGDDLYGDGVNVAARLEGMAEPGGICISAKVYDEVKNKLTLAYVDLGEQKVKNVADPIRVYLILPERPAAERKSGADEIPALADKPSIAVLPFDNMSGDPEQEFFVDGITEDIITTLSKIPDLFVIARNSTFTYKGTAIDVKQVAEELGVRYLVEGSVRKAGMRVRITAQLIDATTGNHRWAERYDRDLSDIFALQDEMAREIVTAVDVELTEGEQIRVWREGAGDPVAYEHFSRGRDYFSRSTRKALDQARVELEKALALNPQFAAAHAYLGWTHAVAAWWRLSEDVDASRQAAREAADRALSLDEAQPDALVVKAYLHILTGEYEQALDAAERAASQNPNNADVHNVLAIVRNYSGDPEEALVASRHALRLSPRMSYNLLELGHAFCLLERYDEAIAPLRQLLADRPYWQSARALIVVALVGLDSIEEARKQAEEMLKISPGFSLNSWAEMHPYKNSADRKCYLDGLRRAGLPE
jgi:adenylate cyclase